MLKRTKGRILLTTLVITGLAGTVKNTTLTSQERNFAVSQIKETKTDLLRSIKGLTTEQLNFKSNPEKWSIKDHLQHIAIAEKTLWGELEKAMRKPATPENRNLVKLSDDEVINVVNDHPVDAKYSVLDQPADLSWGNHRDAANNFKSTRAKQLKYIKTTTGDLRNRYIHLSLGWIDCYQFILFITAYNEGHVRQIQQILADPEFPAQ